MIPWNFTNFDKHFFPSEEFEVSRVEINEDTGKEVITHYSHADFTGIPYSSDQIIYLPRY